jgi:hypothetical protein
MERIWKIRKSFKPVLEVVRGRLKLPEEEAQGSAVR